MRSHRLISLIGLLTVMVSAVAGCGDDDESQRVLALQFGQVNEESYKSYLHTLLQGDQPYCAFLNTLEGGHRVDSVPLPPGEFTPIAGATASPEDVTRAAELIGDACEEFRDEVEG
jgi:hypothetical protein